MMRKSLVSLLGCASLVIAPLAFSEEVDHFEGQSAETLQQAVSNFKEYNQKLDKILGGDLTPEDMNNVHQLTYTLENALGKINEEFDALAETLETIHLASERADSDAVKTNGEKYLSVSRQVIK